MPASLSTVKPTCIGSKMSCDFTLSASLQSWLGHELEVRGIDAVIYTRYILSILQQDSFELEHTDASYFPLQKKEDSTSLPWKAKSKGKKKSSTKTPSETLKKNAAVECLLSVTDEDSGIEGLVDELYHRLQNQKEVSSQDITMPPGNNIDLHESDSVISTSPEDPAERYYAAFPALSDDPPAQTIHVKVEKPMVWSQVAQKSLIWEQNTSEVDSGSEEVSLSEHQDDPTIDQQTSQFSLPESYGHSLLQDYKGKQKQGTISETKSWPNLQAMAPPEFIVPKMQSTSSSARSPHPQPRPFNIQSVPEPVPKLLEDMFHEASQSMLASHLTEELTVVDDKEDFAWYTEPVDQLMNQSAGSSERLYRRQLSSRNSNLDQMELSFDYLFENDKEDEPLPQETPSTTTVRSQRSSEDFGLAGLIDQMKDWAVEDAVHNIHIYSTDIIEEDPNKFKFTQTWNTVAERRSVSSDVKSEDEVDDDVFLPTSTYSCNLNTGKSNQQASLFSSVPAGSLWVGPSNNNNSSSSSELKRGEQNDGTLPGLDEDSTNKIDFSVWTLYPEKSQDQEIQNSPPGSTSDTITPSGSLVDSCGSTLGSFKLSNSSEVTASLWSQVISEQQEAETFPSVSFYANKTCDKCSNNNILGTVEKDQLSGKPRIWAFDENADKTDWPEPFDKDVKEEIVVNADVWVSDACKDIKIDDTSHQAPCLAAELPPCETLQLWDVNIQSKHDRDHPLPRDRAGTMESIKKYLQNISMGRMEEEDLQSLDFIEGGLYGSGLDVKQNIWKGNVESSDNSLLAEEDSQLWKDFSLEPNFNKLRSTSLSQIDDSANGQYTSAVEVSPSYNMEIQPSENSAFKDQIPHRVTGMSHSHSSPAFFYIGASLESSRKMVQVKHLYNFSGESGILEQLGLANEGEVGSDELEYSPERHFRPIKTPCDKNQAANNNNNNGKQRKCESEDKIDMGPRDGYQAYQKVEQEDDASELERRCRFVPKFKVENKREKYIQTGKSLDEGGEDDLFTMFALKEEDEDNLVEQEMADRKLKSLTEHTITQMLNAMQDYDIASDEEEASGDDKVTVNEIRRQCCNVEEDEAYASHNDSDSELVSVHDASMESTGHTGIASLWAIPSKDEVYADRLMPAMYKSIWSCGTDNDIPSLPGSFKEVVPIATVEELDTAAGSLKAKCFEPTWSSGNDYDLVVGLDDNSDISSLDPSWNLKPLTTAPLDFDIQMLGSDMGYQLEGQVHLSTDLEYQWLSSGNILDIMDVTLPKRKPKRRLPPQKKPCSFFMEGGCKRSDCKFSHDISTITCRFWEDGDCFKGDTCPFLHAYPSDLQIGEESEQQQQQQQQEFSLENQDFPELSTSKESQPPVPSSLKKDKRREAAEKMRVSYLAYRRRGSKAKSLPIKIKQRKK